jgi:Na+-driven multidrug efflux pump
MRISILTTIVMIGAEWAFIFGRLGLPPFGVTGVAVGTAAGATLGLVLLAWVVFGGQSAIRLRLRHLRPDAALIRRILGLSWQPLLQLSTRVIVTLVFARLAAGFGTAAQAAFAVGMRVDLIPLALGLPIANAAATLVGQNLGADEPERAARSVWIATTWHAALLWPLAIVLLLVPDRVVGFFAADPEVIAAGATYLRYSAVSFFFMAVYMVQFRALQGSGEMIPVMVISVPILLAITLPLAFLLSRPSLLGLEGLWAASLASIVIVTGATAAWYATGRWKKRRLVAREPTEVAVVAEP